jgi:flagellar hook-associated protein FlgK
MVTLGNNASTAAGVEFTANNLEPSVIIPRGADNIALMMEVPYDSNLRLQVMNSEGVHILGHSIDSATQTAMLSGDSGFNTDSAYSSTYLNTVGSDAYMDMDLTYGFLATSIERQEWIPNANGDGLQEQTTTINAQVETAPVRIQENVSGSTVDLIAADTLVLNGHSLTALTIADGTESSAATMASWLNSAKASTGVTATASNAITVAQEDIDLLQQVRINNVLIAGASSIDALSAAINAKSASTKVTSYVSRDGGLIISNALGHEGETITLSNPDASSATNALGQKNQAYAGSLHLDSSDKIRFTFGTDGVPADLAVLGLRTGIYMDGAASEDLAVFVTGSGNANIAAGFSPPPLGNDTEESPFSLDFTSETRYSITDTATGTVVATRDYVAGDDIHYQTLTLSFDSAPKTGDRFIVDSNEGGIGDNGNMLLLVALQDKPVLANGRTISDGYIDLVSNVGNKATLGKISQEALQVVYDQAVESRDQVSGVSLDQEAADLIRLQQAYQASAQIIQMSSKIFDSILGIR